MSNFTNIENASLFPVSLRAEGPPGALVGGVYDHEGAFRDEAVFFRAGIQMIYPLELPVVGDAEQIDTSAVFGGYNYSHFGHFLLESISRLHVASQFPDLPIIWLKDPNLKPWQRFVCRVLGLRNEHIFLSSAVRVPNLIVGDCGFSIRTFFRPYHAQFLGQYAKEMVPGRKIWLSRSKLADKHGGIDNDADIETVLINEGWDIFHPEEHGIEKQIDVLATAQHIAGFEGSAFHLLILLKEVKARVDIFARGPSINRNFEMIADVKKFKQSIHFLDLEKLSGVGSYSRYIAKNPVEVSRILKE
jgi:capsular polysaccharide biosynthesis protein